MFLSTVQSWKLYITVWASPYISGHPHYPAFGGVSAVYYFVSSCCKVLHYLEGCKVIKQLGSQWETLSCTEVFFIPEGFKVPFDLRLSCTWTQFLNVRLRQQKATEDEDFIFNQTSALSFILILVLSPRSTFHLSSSSDITDHWLTTSYFAWLESLSISSPDMYSMLPVTWRKSWIMCLLGCKTMTRLDK